MMYNIWFSYYGECIALCAWGIVLVLARRILFGKLYRNAAMGNMSGEKMIRQMTLKFEKSYELKTEIPDRETFVEKYMCHEKRFGIRLIRWRRLPERWSGLILCVGFLEAVTLSFLEYRASVCVNRFLAAAAAAVLVRTAILWFESDSLWSLAEICLKDYVSNTMYPRQLHLSEVGKEKAEDAAPAGENEKAVPENAVRSAEKEKKEPRPVDKRLKPEEEKLFQEVMTNLFGQPT